MSYWPLTTLYTILYTTQDIFDEAVMAKPINMVLSVWHNAAVGSSYRESHCKT